MQLVLFQFIFGVDVLIFPNIFRQVPPRGRLSELYLKSGFVELLEHSLENIYHGTLLL